MTELNAREALEQLPGTMKVPKGGGVKIFAHFTDGRLGGVKVALVRLPPQAINGCGPTTQTINTDTLERVAAALELIHGHVELIAEYSNSTGNELTLRWVDYSWIE